MTVNWTVPATEVKVGDRFRSLGTGFIGRDVTAVISRCNCESGTRSIDPVTREALHFPVVEVQAGTDFRHHFRADSLVTLTDGY